MRFPRRATRTDAPGFQRRVALGCALFVVLAMLGTGCGGSKSGSSGSGSPGTGSTGSGGSSAGVNVLTYHNDNARTGQNLNETILTTANVKSSTFGKIGTISVTGNVDAEPLYAAGLTVNGGTHNVLFVATEQDWVYAFDADTFAQLWSASVANGETSPGLIYTDCLQVEPTFGVTATPVIDLSAGAHGTIFVVAMTQDSGGNYHQRLHALDITTGHEQPGSPTEITSNSFDPKQYEERVGLLLLKGSGGGNGTIYLGWTSHCDIEPYQGWVMAYSESTLQQTVVLHLTPTGSEGAVWMSGTAMSTDSSGNIYLLAANGTFGDGTANTPLTNGFPTSANYGNAFLKLSTTSGSLNVADYFTMFNTMAESQVDEDLGSGGAVVLPDLMDSHGVTHHLAVGAGKDGYVYVVNRDSMGKFNVNNDTAVYQKLDDPQGNGSGMPVLGGKNYSMPAYFNNTVYFGAAGDSLKALPISNALLATQPSSESAFTFSFPGCTPSVSANGSANPPTNGILWCILAGSTGRFYAFDASNLANELYDSTQAGSRDQFADYNGTKFVTPLIANGKVYVGAGSATGSGSVVVFGLLDGSSSNRKRSGLSSFLEASIARRVGWTEELSDSDYSPR